MINLKKITLKSIISWLITVLFIVYLYSQRDIIISTISNIKLGFILLVITGQLIMQISNALILRASLKPLGVNLGVLESLRVSMVSSFVNFFTPVVGGVSTKAVYLKHNHSLKYSSFAGAVYANYAIMLTISLILGCVGIFLIPGAFDSGVGIFLELLLVGLALLIGVFIFFGHHITAIILKTKTRGKKTKRFLEKIELVDSGWNNIRKDIRAVTEIVLWSFAAMIGLIMVFWASISGIGADGNIGTYMIFAAFANLSILFNLTPGGIGVREALYASAYQITSISAQQVVAFSLIDRAVQLIVLGCGWLFFGKKVLEGTGKSNSKQQ